MEDSKKYTKLFSLILLVSIFAGWQVMLLVAILLLLFGKVEEPVKKMAIAVITFAAGLALFNLFWELISSGISLVISGITSLITFFNSYLDSPISILNLQRYLFNPIQVVVAFLDLAIKYAITFMKFCFIVAMLAGKEMKSNFIFDKIKGFITKFTDFVSEKSVVDQSTEN